MTQITCPDCLGQKFSIARSCRRCLGTGKLPVVLETLTDQNNPPRPQELPFQEILTRLDKLQQTLDQFLAVVMAPIPPRSSDR